MIRIAYLDLYFDRCFLTIGNRGNFLYLAVISAIRISVRGDDRWLIRQKAGKVVLADVQLHLELIEVSQ